MRSRNVAPVSDPLPCPEKYSKDGLVSPRNRRIDQSLCELRVELLGDLLGHTSAELPVEPLNHCAFGKVKNVRSSCNGHDCDQNVRELDVRFHVEDGAIIVDKVRGESNVSTGFNADIEKIEDLVDSGVIDPTKVVRVAIQNSSSIAGLLLTSRMIPVCTYVRKPDRDASTL